jgi:CO/xanthine dehydrogenase FAD-binding subunit
LVAAGPFDVMRSYIPDYEMKTPESLAEALRILAHEPGIWKAFAGGTDLMVLLEAGKLSHRRYLNIWGLEDLQGIEVTHGHISLGALVTYTDIQAHSLLRDEFPMLCQAASETGGLAIQNRGTLGGNIVNASPAADAPPALLAYDAELELISNSGLRRVSYSKFHSGYKQMDIRPDELLARINLPRVTSQFRHYYRKVGTRMAQAISKVCFAAVGAVKDREIKEVRIALGSVAPVPLRCLKTEELLRGRTIDPATVADAKSQLGREITPIDDIRSTKNYRLRVSLNLLEDFLTTLMTSP